MIRIVTAGRLRRLAQDTEQARTRAREVQGQADAAWGRHVREVWELTARAETAESDAAILRDHVAEFETALERAAVDASALRERVRLLDAELAQARLVGRSLVLLLHWGEPHSIHASREDAYDYAATQGAPVHGWTTTDERPHTAVAWRAISFTRDEAVMGLRNVTVRSPHGGEGAA